MSTSASDFKTVDGIRKTAEDDYEQEFPRPMLPEPPLVVRPGLVRVGTGAHVWIEVTTESGGYDRPGRLLAQFFIVDRSGGKDQRIEGELTPENIEALLQELTRVREEVLAKQTFLHATAAYEKQQKDWEKARTEFTRRRVAEWERASGEKR